MNAWLRKIFPEARLRHPETPAASEEQILWQETFRNAAVLVQEPQEVSLARQRLTDLIARTYRRQQELWQTLAGLVNEVIQIVDFCEELKNPAEDVQAIQRQLNRVLSQAGLEPWRPEEGQSLPDNCEVVESQEQAELAEGTVLRVVTPGYRWKDGRIFRPPRLVVARPPGATQGTDKH